MEERTQAPLLFLAHVSRCHRSALGVLMIPELKYNQMKGTLHVCVVKSELRQAGAALVTCVAKKAAQIFCAALLLYAFFLRASYS